MKAVGIFGKSEHPEIQALARTLGALAVKRGLEVLVESTLSGLLDGERVLEPAQLAAQADVVVVLGGDGTMIRAARMLDGREVPVFGVNLGFLGYMTNFTVEEAQEQFEKVLAGDYEIEPRARLSAELVRDGQNLMRATVLNDVVVNVSGISRIIEIRTEIDDAFVTTYRADGLIVSTPTGSTAYSLAAGGPILIPGTRALVVAPICPHTLTMRPLVIQDDVRIGLTIVRGSDQVQATFDGQQAETLQLGDRLEIERAKGRLQLVKPPRDYYKILHAKLKWGQR